MTQADITLSPDQSAARDAIRSWYAKRDTQSFVLAGFAGTGKTTIMGQVTEALNVRSVIYAAYTGKAAHVLRSKLPRGTDVRTLHSLLYKPRPIRICTQSLQKLVGTQCMPHRKERRSSDCPWREEVTFQLKMNNDERPELIIVDEASMVSTEIQNDLLDLGVPVLFTGDHGQLPPVQSTGNVMEYPDVRLERIHRQAEGNPIIMVSKIYREEGELKPGSYGDGSVVKLTNEQFRRADHSRINAAKAVVLCGFNRTRAAINRAGAGNDGFRPGVPAIVLRNDYDLGVMNGMRGEITQVHRVVDGKLMADIQFEGEETPRTLMAYTRVFGTERVPDGVEKDCALLDYGYALTVHKSQGSQWNNVALIEERLPGTDHARFCYTGVTRAVSKLLIIGD